MVTVVNNLTRSNQVKRTSAECIFVFINGPQSEQATVSLIVNGIENGNEHTRVATCELLVDILTPECAIADYTPLVTSLVGRLRDVSDEVVATAAKALQACKSAIGQGEFDGIIKKLPTAYVKLYMRHVPAPVQ